MTISEGSTTQLISTKNSNTINRLSIKQIRDIEEVCGNSSKVDKVDIINVNNTKVSNFVKSKDLI